jgi:hypothetical protein
MTTGLTRCDPRLGTVPAGSRLSANERWRPGAVGQDDSWRDARLTRLWITPRLAVDTGAGDGHRDDSSARPRSSPCGGLVRPGSIGRATHGRAVAIRADGAWSTWPSVRSADDARVWRLAVGLNDGRLAIARSAVSGHLTGQPPLPGVRSDPLTCENAPDWTQRLVAPPAGMT